MLACLPMHVCEFAFQCALYVNKCELKHWFVCAYSICMRAVGFVVLNIEDTKILWQPFKKCFLLQCTRVALLARSLLKLKLILLASFYINCGLTSHFFRTFSAATVIQ